jgi:hypothetical protein
MKKFLLNKIIKFLINICIHIIILMDLYNFLVELNRGIHLVMMKILRINLLIDLIKLTLEFKLVDMDPEMLIKAYRHLLKEMGICKKY